MPRREGSGSRLCYRRSLVVPYEERYPSIKLHVCVNACFCHGFYEIILGDTIGVATPNQVKTVLRNSPVPLKRSAWRAIFMIPVGRHLLMRMLLWKLGLPPLTVLLVGFGGLSLRSRSSRQCGRRKILSICWRVWESPQVLTLMLFVTSVPMLKGDRPATALKSVTKFFGYS